MRVLLLAGRLAVVLVLVASTQSVLLVRTAFEMDREAIAERLCVNRDRPELECHGTCVLSRMLRDQQERESQHQQARLELALSVTPLVAEAAPVPPPAAAPVPAASASATLAWAEGVAGTVDRPPRQG